jgi:PAP2 superfamily
MKYKLTTAVVAVTAMVVATLTALTVTTTGPARAAAGPLTWPIDQWGTPQPTDDAVLKWDEQLLSAIRANPGLTGPTVASRAFGVLFTAMYDAWAAYDPVAKVTQNAGPSQQTTGDTEANKTEAISYAADRTLNDLFPPSQFPSCSPATTPCRFPAATYQIPDVLLTQQGFDPTNTTPASPTDTAATPAAVGNLAAKAVTDFRHNDGSNQLNGYADTTGYQPVNTWNQVNDRWRWQPLCVPTPPPGATSCSGTIQKALGPQWGKVIPFSAPMTMYYTPGPPKNPDGSYSTSDITQALQDTSNLTDFQKVTAEYWADGPGTGFPPGHWMLFAEALSRKNNFSLDTDVKLFFTLGNALMDSGIACWYYKYKYDFVRPITAIHVQYYNQYVTSWLGPNKGYGLVLGQNWIPYQALSVVTPPFPEYPSGHSTFSAAGASILAAFTGGDTFGVTVTIPAGSSTFEPGTTPAQPITLSFATFSDASNSSGISRRYGGIHFLSGDTGGRGLGRQVAQFVWGTAQNYIHGYAGKPGS